MATPTILGQSSSLSPFAGPYVTDMLGKGAALADMPYQAYQGPLTAGQSQLQNQAFTGLANLAVPQASMAGSFTGAGYTPPSAQEAIDTSATGYTPFLAPQDESAVRAMPQNNFTPATDNVMQQYMTPYLQGALQPQYDAAARQAQIAQQGLQSRYGKAGAYGGARQTIAETELERGLLDRMAGITGAGYQDAFEQAQNQFNTEQNYGLQALAAQRAGGAEQRAIESQGVMADIAQFETERDYPFKQVQYQQSLLQGLPISTETRQYAEPSALGQFAGGASGIIGLLQSIGLVPTQQGDT